MWTRKKRFRRVHIVMYSCHLCLFFGLGIKFTIDEYKRQQRKRARSTQSRVTSDTRHGCRVSRHLPFRASPATFDISSSRKIICRLSFFVGIASNAVVKQIGDLREIDNNDVFNSRSESPGNSQMRKYALAIGYHLTDQTKPACTFCHRTRGMGFTGNN